MTLQIPSETRRGRRHWGLLALVCMLLLGCSAQQPATELEHAVAKEAATQAPDMVDLTLYFRQGRGAAAYLVPVVREVPVGTDLPRTALDLTLRGPASQDPPDLQPAVPPATEVRSFAVDGTTATVDLSADVVRRAADVGDRPEHELLALAAITNTLTEFPEITRVALTVDGASGGAFWGGWGLPEVLFRDDSVVGSEAVPGDIPALDTFSRRTQVTGGARRSGAVVSGVRIRPRSTYLRVTVELTDAEGAGLIGSAPPARVTRDGDDIRMTVDAEAAAGVAGDQPVEDPAFRSARVDVSQTPPAVSVTVSPQRRTDFALRTLTDPTRIVLDIRR